MLKPELLFVNYLPAIKSPFPEGKGWAGVPGHWDPRGGAGNQHPEPFEISGCDGQLAQEAFARPGLGPAGSGPWRSSRPDCPNSGLRSLPSCYDVRLD